MSFTPYQEYTEVDGKWFTKLPISWAFIKGRHLFINLRRPATSDDEQLTASQKYGVIPQKLFMEQEDQKVMLAIKGTDSFKHVDVDNFVISLRSFQGGIERAKYAGCVSPAYTVLKFVTEEAFPKFYEYLLKSKGYVSQLQSMTDGMRDGKSISFDQFSLTNMPLPPKEDQELIVKFLEKETSKIDSLIAEQGKLIELLKRKRQAVISHAVTQGIDPNAKMKDSEVEWLGAVPEHWDVVAGRYIFNIKKNIVGELGYDILSITQKGIVIKDTESNEGQLSMDYSKYQLVEIDDFAMNHMDLLTGFVDISKFRGVTSPDYRVFELARKDCYPQYYLFLLQNCYINKIFFPYGQGSAQLGRWRLPTDQFKEFKYPMPSINEQVLIAEYLEDQISKFIKLIDESSEVIRLLRERRTSLISSAVTGQIDVRSALKSMEAA